MRIDRIELFHVRMPLIEPWRTAYGEDAEVESLLCRFDSGSVHAWGEASPLAAPCYSSEWAGGVFATVEKWLAPALIGQVVDSPEDLQLRLGHFKGNPFAHAVLDIAWWGLQSRLVGQPLHQLLGATRDWVPVGADFGVTDSIDKLVGEVDSAVAAGFPRVKLKFRPGWDLPVVQEVRKAFPQLTVHIDCNSGYALRDVDVFRAVDEFELAMIEQPLAHDDFNDHARLQNELRTPLCLDESLSAVRHANTAIQLKSCRFANIKPGRVGGLTNAVKMHALFAEAGIPCWVGGMLESATGSSICSALAMLDNFVYPADIFPTERFYERDLAERTLDLTTSNAGVPGVIAPESIPDPDPARLAAWTVRSMVLKP